jgi:GT2 family glycosyltransferase
MRCAVITLVAGRHSHLQLQRSGLLAGTLLPDRHVVVTMQDRAARSLLGNRPPPVDIVETTRQAGALPLARARNLGAQRALQTGADLLIFLDVDCVPGPALVSRYVQQAARETRPSLLCGPVSYLPPPPRSGYQLSSLAALGRPHPARPVPPETGVLAGGDHALFWSLSFAVRATIWREIGGFCEEYTGYGAEDTDFGQLAARRGVALTWVGGAWAYHQHHPGANPPVQHLADIVRNAAVFHRRWGWWPMGGWLREFERRGLIVFDPRRRACRIVPAAGTARPAPPGTVGSSTG